MKLLLAQAEIAQVLLERHPGGRPAAQLAEWTQQTRTLAHHRIGGLRNVGDHERPDAESAVQSVSISSYRWEEHIEEEHIEQERLIGRLVLWNRVWLGVLIAISLACIGQFGLAAIHRDMETVQAGWDGRGLRLTSIPGQFVVTLLGDEETWSWAALPKPIAVLDSFGAYIAREEMNKLDWSGRHNEPTEFPGQSSHISAMFNRPEFAIGKTAR